ncbi:MAG: endonuclease III domain-containing protein [Candidatus Bathyarchaeia archaeon]
MKKIVIDKIVPLLKEEVKQFVLPAVTEVSRKSEPFLVLISCLLSLRTRDAVTEKASDELFKLAKTPKKMQKLSTRTIAKVIYPVSFYKTKTRRIKEICKTLIEKYDSRIPDEIDELLKLKGVGRKTANIVITYGFNKDGIAVDTHVHRICNRLGLVETKTPEQTEFELRRKLAHKYWRDFNDVLVTHGQNVCLPISPLCSKCSISSYCYRVGITRSR